MPRHTHSGDTRDTGPRKRPRLTHTERVRRLIEQDKAEAAKTLHNRQVRRQMRRAQDGVVIDLTDLMAARELLELERPPEAA